MNRKIRVTFLCIATAAGVCGQTNSNGASSTARFTPLTPGTLTLTGIVMLDDGSQLPGNVSIQMVCGGTERTVAQTLLTGNFGFQWNPSAATVSMPLSSSFNPRAFQPGPASDTCELRAELGGYTSGTVNLANPQRFDGCDIGVIWLHRMGGTGGNMVSVSTLRAPKDAHRNFDKGNELLIAGKLQEAVASYNKAVTEYPEFAEAWMNLGRAQYKMAANEAAVASSLKAVALDPKTAGAWQVLGFIAADDKDWKSAVGYLAQAERLDPLRSVLTWYYSAIAYYELGQFDDAERSIRTEMKLDPQLRYRRSQYVLGLILIARRDMNGGEEMLRDYLAASPDARDVAPAKTILSRLQTIAAK